MSDTFTRAEIPATACGEGLKWLDAHWPQGRETWNVREALEAGCDLSHALWVLALRQENRPLLVAFALDCAERVLPHFHARHPGDQRPRRAIDTARAWLRGDATLEEVRSAYSAAADAAADAAASAYAAAAASDAAAYAAAAASASSAYAAAASSAYAAYAASDAAAYAAADAAYSAAAAERAWQRARLMEMLAGEPAQNTAQPERISGANMLDDKGKS